MRAPQCASPRAPRRRRSPRPHPRRLAQIRRPASQLDSGPSGDDGDAVKTDADHKVVISILEEATTAACAQFLERVRECRSRTRPDILKHLVQMFDLKFLQALNPLTTGSVPSRLNPLQLLQVIDCVEGFLLVRVHAVGSLHLAAQENRPGQVLRETRRDLIAQYLEIMAPKLQGITDKVLRKLLEGKENLVTLNVNQRIVTPCPADLFSLMSEHLKIARQGGSLTLQRKLLSLLMAEIARYSGQVLLSLMEECRTTFDTLSVDFVTACINDAGTMLDLLEQLEADFAPALAKVTLDAGTDLQRMQARAAGASPAEARDELDVEEEEQAREDLAAIEQDIPRARSELLKCGTQLTGVLLDVIQKDLAEPLNKLFCAVWDRENVVSALCNTAKDYLFEQQSLLDAYWHEKLVGWVLAAVVANYTLRLINPDSVPRVLGAEFAARHRYAGGFGKGGGMLTEGFRLTPVRKKKMTEDEIELRSVFAPFLPPENFTLILQALHQAVEMLTAEAEIIADVLEAALRQHPAASVEVFLVFEKAIALREDMGKADKRRLIDEAKKMLFTYGQPLDDADELLAMSALAAVVAASRQRARARARGMEAGCPRAASAPRASPARAPRPFPPARAQTTPLAAACR